MPGDDGLNSSSNINGNTSSVSSTDEIISKWFIFGLLFYFAAQIFLRTVVSSSLESDEAEQVLFTQWLRGSYLSKPPLYTWLQIFFFKMLGTNVFALSLLKNSLLFSTYAFVFASGRLLLRDSRLALLAALSLLLIPQICWESQRDLTHSILVTSLSAMSFYVVLRLLESQSARYYLWMGVAIGLGTLAKYNYAIFIAAVLITLLTYPQGRSVLIDKRASITLAAVVVIVLPYLLWVVSHFGTVTSSLHDLDIGRGDFFIKGSVRLLYVTTMFLGPLCLVYLLVFPRGFVRLVRNRPLHEISFPMQRYFLILFCLLWCMILGWEVTYFKDRWMQPLLFIFPLYFFIYINDASAGIRMRRFFVAITLIAALTILVMIPARIVLGPALGYYTSFNFPYAALAAKVGEHCPEPDLIVADSQLDAGNIRLQFPNSLVLAPNLKPFHIHGSAEGSCFVAFWDAQKSVEMPERLKKFLISQANIVPDDLKVIYEQLPYKYADGRYARVGLALTKRSQ